MAVTRRKTNEVLASARRDVEAQLAVVRDELSRLSSEEAALTQALSSLVGNGGSSGAATKSNGDARAGATPSSPARSSTRKAATGRRRRRRGTSKSTADRVNELRELLADGPKSRSDLATALAVSPARVQQLLAELGGSVSSQPDPEQRRGKLWSLKGSANGTSTQRAPTKPGSSTPKRPSARKTSGRSKPAAK